jgi:hypothetical protein
VALRLYIALNGDNALSATFSPSAVGAVGHRGAETLLDAGFNFFSEGQSGLIFAVAQGVSRKEMGHHPLKHSI